MKCWNSALNAQSSRLIIVLVQLGTLNTHVTAVEMLMKNERQGETQFTTKIDSFLSFIPPWMLMYLFCRLFLISPCVWPNSGLWCCVVLTLRIPLLIETSGCPWPKATVKPPVWNPGPKIEIPHPENHVLKVFRFRSWKPRVWKSRPQSWDPKSWKPCPKISQAPKLRSQVLKTMSWKPYPKISQAPKSAGPVSRPPWGVPGSIPGLRSALECPNLISSNSFAHRLGTGNSALRLASAWRFPERTAVAVPVLVRLPHKEWRVGQTDRRTYLPDCSPSHVPSTFLSKESMGSSQPWCRQAYHQKSHTGIVLSLALISKFVVLLHPQIYWHDNSAGELKCRIVVSDGQTDVVNLYIRLSSATTES
jgi:hypothetical protein